MKTIIDLPDALYRRTKIRASEHHTARIARGVVGVDPEPAVPGLESRVTMKPVVRGRDELHVIPAPEASGLRWPWVGDRIRATANQRTDADGGWR